MAICSVCEREAAHLLNGRWFCRNCMQETLDSSGLDFPLGQKKVMLLDDTKRVIHAPFCSICQDRIAMFVIGGVGKCRDCFKAKRDWPDMPEENEVLPAKPKRSHLGTCIVDFPNEYVCVDVETTGRAPDEDEIIEVAALHVKDGTVCDIFTSLIKPLYSHVPWTLAEVRSLGYQSFDDVPRTIFEDDSNRRMLPAEIVKLTKITDNMLQNAPAAGEVIPQFYKFVGDHILVGHNAIFDINFLYDACQRCGLLLTNNYVDTLRISRNLLPELPGHKLSDLVRHFKIVQETAHRAEADAHATVKCLEAMKAQVLQTQTISEYIEGFVDPGIKPSARARKKIYAEKKLRPADLVAPDVVDSFHPLYGKNIVFTGELNMDRIDAAQMAVNVGAVVKTAVSGKTDILVVGQQDVALVGSSGTSSKERKAQELNASGKGHIEILTEQDFLRLVGPEMKAGEL